MLERTLEVLWALIQLWALERLLECCDRSSNIYSCSSVVNAQMLYSCSSTMVAQVLYNLLRSAIYRIWQHIFSSLASRFPQSNLFFLVGEYVKLLMIVQNAFILSIGYMDWLKLYFYIKILTLILCSLQTNRWIKKEMDFYIKQYTPYRV